MQLLLKDVCGVMFGEYFSFNYLYKYVYFYIETMLVVSCVANYDENLMLMKYDYFHLPLVKPIPTLFSSNYYVKKINN